MMTDKEFIYTIQHLVSDYANEYNREILEVTRRYPVKPEDVYIVWQAKILQNRKAMAITSAPDGMYFEITFNGDNEMVYLDAYCKRHNQSFMKATVLEGM